MCREIASMVLRYLHVCGYRLLVVPKRQQRLLSSYWYCPSFKPCLDAAAFSAVQAGVHANVLVGFQSAGNKQLNMDFPLGKDSLLSLSVPFSVNKT